MQEVYYKKQALGMWRREVEGVTKHITEEELLREVERLVNEGWRMRLIGMSLIRGIMLVKD